MKKQRTQPRPTRSQYAIQVTFLSHIELMAEHESLKNLCQHLSADNTYHGLRRIARQELISRGLEVLA